MLKANINKVYDGIDGKVLPNVFKTRMGTKKTYLSSGEVWVRSFRRDITYDFSLKEEGGYLK